MDIEQAPLSDAGSEDDDLTTADWIADVDRYYQDDRPQERQPNEFTIQDWRALMGKRRGISMSRNQAAAELEKMLAGGTVTRRLAFIDGRRGWLYSFRKD